MAAQILDTMRDGPIASSSPVRPEVILAEALIEVARREREACAKVAEETLRPELDNGTVVYEAIVERVAAAIRART